MIQVLAKRLKAHLVIMTRGVYEISAKAPEGYVWADNGQTEIHDQQWEGESRRDVKENMLERMQKGLQRA